MMRKDIEAALLCGGLGTRLQSVLKDTPKGLAGFGHRTFLEIQIEYFVSHGINHFILCTGFLGDKIQKNFKQRPLKNVAIDIVREDRPLGTAGAIRNALTKVSRPRLLVSNGDCYCAANLSEMIEQHRRNHADVTLLVSSIDDPKDYGTVEVNNLGSVIGFREKSKDAPPHGLISAGTYIFERHILEELPKTFPSSLETDFFPCLLKRPDTKFEAFLTKAEVIDIGTPSRYEASQEKLRRLGVEF